jgi:tRNA(Ile)-lysidine synthase
VLADFKSHIENEFPFLKEVELLIACSGGMDSVVLSDLLNKLEYNFALAHCNFTLRGNESDKDEQFVTQFSKNLDVKLHSVRFDTKKEIEERGGSTQMVARDLRYEWFQELLEINTYEYILTAHHADDGLETFIINLSRGTGLDGLTGIPQINGKIVRPLLAFSREDILAYAEANKLSWREDSSNADTKYLRNEIRKEIIPKLKGLNPNFLSNFLSTQTRLKASTGILENTKKELQTKLFIEKGSSIRISIEQLLLLEPLDSYLYLLFQEYGFTAWKDVLDLLQASSGKEVRSNTHRLIKNREDLLLVSILDKIDAEFYISKDKESIKNPLELSIEKVKEITEVNKNTLYADIEKLNYPLMLRKWRKGDYFYPLGMSGKKKLSKYFKDEKVDIVAKDEQWMLCSNEQIVWVLGRRADERFKVTPSTKQIVKITWQS